ncbi:hypothetical protein EPR50_G00231460 [Perca flavescens]|uniref:Cleavage and polyadenylation specificity factor subunit 6 n=1 Tax=Perca flavescens TaxID=8167 RepID=A0A484C043_PERFV|nr:hypothetical protein EPR50_G00231460 [Perca flavescens]
MADGVDHIDIYADVEEEFNQEADYPVHEQIDLYDDVISPSANNGDAPEDRDYLDTLPTPGGSEGGKSSQPNVVYTYTGKRIALYIGNLTWWTTDEDLTEAIRSVGITDVLEIKFFENRANGQSKGFALVCVASEASSRKLMELLSKRELHGQNPIVTPCNKQSLSQFEMQSRKSTQSGQMSGEGKAGPPGAGPRGGFPMGRGRGRFPGPPGPGGDRFPGPVGPGGPPPHFPGPGMRPDLIRHQDGPLMDMSFNPFPPGGRNGSWRGRGGMQGPPRPPPGPPGPPGPPPPGQGLPPPLAGPPNRGDRPPPPVLFPGPPPGGPPPAPHVNPAFFPPPGNNNMPPNDSRGPPGPNDPYGRPPPYERGDYGPGGREMEASRTPLSEAEFEEIMNRNRAISSSAISRAVSDASAADYGIPCRTVFTALSQKVTVPLPGENVPGNETTAALEKRAGVTSPAVVTGMRTITENAAGSGTVIGRGTVTETGRGRESTDTAKREGSLRGSRMDVRKRGKNFNAPPPPYPA